MIRCLLLFVFVFVVGIQAVEVLYNTACWDFTTLDTYDTAVISAVKANPTLAEGDVKISIDGGAFANLDTLPDAYPASGKAIRLRFKAANLLGKTVIVIFHDQTSPAEWCDKTIIYHTFGHASAFTTYYPSDVKLIGASATTMTNLGKYVGAIKTFTIDTTTFTPTRTIFETTLTDTVKNWYIGRYIIFESGATDVALQKVQITQYRVVDGKARISCTGLTTRPFHLYAGIIIP